MKLTIQVDDALFDKYKAMGNGSIQATTKAIEDQLKRFQDIDPHERTLVIYGPERQALEKVFQTTVSSGKELVRKVQGLSRFQIGDVVRYFTEGELITLAEQAAFHGKEAKAYAEMVAQEVLDRAFNRI